MTLEQYKRENREQLRIARTKRRLERKAREANDDRLFLGMLGILFFGILAYAVTTYPIL